MNGQMSTKARYVVWLEAPTHAVLKEQPATFVIAPFLGEQQVTVLPRWRKKLGQLVCDVIQMQTALEAASPDEAIVLASARANRWLAALAFAARVPVGDARALFAYDATPNKEERQFVQYFFDTPWPRPVVVAVEASMVQEVVNGWGRHEGKGHWALSRAFFWYRRGLREPNPADRFTYLWFGLEALEPMLRARLNVRSETSRCPSCNRLLEDPSTAGIKAHLAAGSRGDKFYARARKLRVNILHTVPYDFELQEESRHLAPPLEQALRSAIEAAIECSLAPASRLPPLPDFLCAVRGRILGLMDVAVGKRHPHFRLRRVPTREKPSSLGVPDFDGELVPVGKFKFTVDGWLVPRGTLIAQGQRVVSEPVGGA
jgi:hypothetical protein